MSVSWLVPFQARNFITSTVFTAVWNTPTLGRYDFGVPGNAGLVSFTTQPNTAYLIERISVSADMAEATYTSALDLVGGYPALRLTRGQSGQSVYQSAWPLGGYSAHSEVAVWHYSDVGGDAVCSTVVGRLLQPVGLVGQAVVRLVVRLSVYAVDGTLYQRAVRDGQPFLIGERARGAL